MRDACRRRQRDRRSPSAALTLRRCYGSLLLRQHRFHVRVRTGDDVHADDFALDGFDGLGAGVGGGLDGGDVADDDGGDEGVADLGHRADEFDVRGLEHGVRALDEGDEAAGFNQSNCLLAIVLVVGLIG